MAGLYIHIPYCIKKCAYCDFVSVPTEKGVPEAYFAALLKEINGEEDTLLNTPIDTAFIGGGTPSLLTGEQMRHLTETLNKRFRFAGDLEFTVECNPGTVTAEKLAEFRSCGVNRLSFGLQSASDRLLKAIGRIHNYDGFLHAVEAAYSAGFSNFNVDIMYGLPGQTADDLLYTADCVKQSGATHISAYSLILEENTPLYTRVRNGTVFLPDEDNVADMEDAMREWLAGMGYERYEISNYAKAGYRCRHNVNYWHNGPYIGFGPAAHSAWRMQGGWIRWNNTSDIGAYIRLCTQGEKPVEQREEIPREEEMFETVMLGLRLTEGIPLALFFERFGVQACEYYKEAIGKLRRNGWLNEAQFSKGRLALSSKGLDLQNEALLLFMRD